MDIQQKELSLKFYKFLCDVIGTKQVVNKRRQIFAVREDYDRAREEWTVSSGSKAEGLDLKGSDFDHLILVKDGQVVEQLNHGQTGCEKPSLIMDTENVKPCFAKLLAHHLPSDDPLSDCIEWRTGSPYFSSTLFRQKCRDIMLPIEPEAYVHGPCITLPDGTYDHAFSLYCTDWISQAQPWITRTKHSWASDEVIRNIICSGVLFVPIGSKTSPNTDLEWRISFSYAEKQLIFCFNHVQLLCYALLKIIVKDFIKESFGDMLCSYFLKTIMFWLCEEETDVAFWRKDNLLLCFMTCFRRLIYCVENETCMHYFIPENNLFENRFENQHHDLLSKLHGLHDLGWTCLLETKTLQSFKSYQELSLSSDISLSTFFPCLKYLVDGWIDTSNNTQLIKKFISQCMRSKKKESDLYIYSLSRMCQYVAQKMCDEKSVQGNNKVIYRNLRRSLLYLLIGLNNDAVSGWLLLASFFFTNKQYGISKILIDHSLTKCTPERCEIYRENNVWQLRRYNEIQNSIGLRCLKHYTINETVILKCSGITPDKLDIPDVKKNSCLIPSIRYAHVLNCRYFLVMGDHAEASTSLENLLFYSEKYKQCEQSVKKSNTTGQYTTIYTRE